MMFKVNRLQYKLQMLLLLPSLPPRRQILTPYNTPIWMDLM